MRYGLILGLILLAVVGRLIPHPDNFTPIMAVALFAGATLSPRIAYVVPLAALVVSDLLLGFPLDSMALVVYGCLFPALALASGLQRGGPGAELGSRPSRVRWFSTLSPTSRAVLNPIAFMRTRWMVCCKAMSWPFLSFATPWPEIFSGQRCSLASTRLVTAG
jgi:hypothetical protein